MTTNTDSAELARRLDGKVIVIPDLGRMMSHWPSGRNAHASDMEQHIVELLNGIASPKDKENVIEANPALLASCLWPNASADQLRTLTQMVLWQGRLDDYIEALEYENSERAREFRAKTKEYIAQYLQLSEIPREAPSTSAISDFQQVAQAICRQYDQDQRRALRVSLFEYIDSTISETRYIQSGEVPTNRYYEDLRKRTAGTGPLCALAEYVMHISCCKMR
nr:terpene synthase family protein [Colletotrichum truncatum]KAF6787139.1 terpene synthase family protein [Colletotrichum truncatum]